MTLEARRRMRALVVGLLLAAAGLSCNASVGVGISVPIGGAWGGPYGSVSVAVPIR